MKTSSWLYFLPNLDELGRESEKKILHSNSDHTSPGQENSEKNTKKIQKTIKPFLGISFIQNGTRRTEKQKTKF